MATRTITAKGWSGSPLYNHPGMCKSFDVESDTGAMSLASILQYDKFIVQVTTTELRTYYATSVLQLKFDAEDGDVVVEGGPLAKNNEPHEISMTASKSTGAVFTASPAQIWIGLLDSNYDESVVLGRSEILGTLQIVAQCFGRCTTPGTPWLSTTQSTGDAVVLRWSAGAGGADNAFRYYAVQRQLSTNGGTSWGAWEPLTQTTDTYAVVQPPATVGHRYRYMVRTVGTAGEVGGSDWMVSSDTLLRYEITRCGAPGNVTLSATESSGSVRMSWTAASAGIANSVSYYEVERQLSTDGGTTWGNVWERVGTTSSLYMWVDPPATDGHMYKFLIRAVGTAGTEYASYWVECSKTLKKVKAALISYTDPEILPGITEVKAVHITELQTNINLVRAAANFAPVEFTVFRASYTSLGGWNTHITELRSAIDGMGISHETWLTLGENCPRADVIMQLRRVVEAVAK